MDFISLRIALTGVAFWSRPPATSPFPNNAATSSGSNLGPTSDALRAADPGNAAEVPVDLVTASASDLDPPPLAGRGLLPGRPRRARGLAPRAVEKLIADHIEGRWAEPFEASRIRTPSSLRYAVQVVDAAPKAYLDSSGKMILTLDE
jgi:K+-transporting ATPase c subunit